MTNVNTRAGFGNPKRDDVINFAPQSLSLNANVPNQTNGVRACQFSLVQPKPAKPVKLA